jgi:hypothetical protein
MKLTLVWQVFNKAHHLEDLLTSWLSTLSGQHTYEAIVVCDACVDGSEEIARSVLGRAGKVGRKVVLSTPDVYEIEANNTALRWAAPDSDLIVFIQDDNFMHDQNWDATLIEARGAVRKPGATALLAGGYFLKDGATYQRVECRREHKTLHWADNFPLWACMVDFVTRPFAVSTSLLREWGGLGGPFFDVICWDDTDLSLKLLKRGYVNQYVPFDVLNLSLGQQTMPERMRQGFERNRKVFNAKHGAWLRARGPQGVTLICPAEPHEGGLRLVHPVYDL